MKRLITSFIFILLVTGGFLCAEEPQKLSLYGVIGANGWLGDGEDSGGIIEDFGLSLDYHVNDRIMLSSELEIWAYLFKPIFLVPGVVINYKFSRKFFVGSGFEYLKTINVEEEDNNYGVIKFNVGYAYRNIKIILYASPLLRKADTQHIVFMGLSFNYRF